MNNYEILANAIADVGYWSWWAEALPKAFQIEFGWIQLWNPPIQEGQPPSNKNALKFINPTSISFLTRKNPTKELPTNWYMLLHEDKFEVPSIDHDNFTFTDTDLMRKIIDEASTIDVYHGSNPKEASFFDCKVKLAFWAGEVGFMIGAESLVLRNMQAEIPLDKVGELNGKWWQYWREYYDAKKTAHPFPKDNLCEITIPLTN